MLHCTTVLSRWERVFFIATPSDMTEQEAQDLLDDGGAYFDYLKGRVMKVDLSGDELCVRLYDRDNGQGAAERALHVAGLLEQPE